MEGENENPTDEDENNAEQGSDPPPQEPPEEPPEEPPAEPPPEPTPEPPEEPPPEPPEEPSAEPPEVPPEEPSEEPPTLKASLLAGDALEDTEDLPKDNFSSHKSSAGISKAVSLAEGLTKSSTKSAVNVESGKKASDKSSLRKSLSRIVGSKTQVGGNGKGQWGFLNKRSPFINNPPLPEERRSRIVNPRTPKEYIINLREDLADFQESYGLPRTRDYSFLSLGLALAQETARAIYSLFLMFTELFPIVAIISLILKFALDKIIEILETTEPTPKLKKTIIFTLQMLVIVIPLWILVGTIILPLLSLVLSIFKRVFQLSGGKRKCGAKTKKTCNQITLFDFFC